MTPSAGAAAAPTGPMTSIGIPYATLVEIWNTCEGVHCEAQKPLFQAEKEAEKSLAYLEKIPFTQFTCTMLSNVVKFVFHLLNTKLNYWISLSSGGQAPASPMSSAAVGGGEFTRLRSKGSFSGAQVPSEHMTSNLMSDLLLLQEQIETAIRQLKVQSTQTVRDEGATSAVIILIDSIAGLVEKLENVCLKADEIDSLFKACMSTAANNIVAATASTGGSSSGSKSSKQSSGTGAKDAARAAAAANNKLNDMHRMLVSLALRDNYFVERDEEVSSLMDFIKVLNMQSDANWGPAGAHAWHSYDGRELGLPTSKSYSLRVAAPSSSSGAGGAAGAAAAAPAPPLSPMGGVMSSPNAASISGKHFVALSSASRAESNDFRANNSDGESPVPVAQAGGGVGGGNSQRIVTDFQMDAVIQQNIMRISFKIPESE